MAVLDMEFDGYRPGVLASIVGLHMRYYSRHWGFGRPFEIKVAAGLAAFLARQDLSRDLFENAFAPDGTLLGSITIDGADAEKTGAQLRWLIVSDDARGHGIGRALMRRADDFIRDKGFPRTFLTTFAGLDAARRLYEDFGFSLVSEESNDPWSGTVGVQTFVRERPK